LYSILLNFADVVKYRHQMM